MLPKGIIRPSDEKAKEYTMPVCPRSVRGSRLLAASKSYDSYGLAGRVVTGQVVATNPTCCGKMGNHQRALRLWLPAARQFLFHAAENTRRSRQIAKAFPHWTITDKICYQE
jgi:hypothetical protein